MAPGNHHREYLNVIYVKGNKKDLKEAKKKEISVGKYEVYKKSKEKNKGTTIDEIKEMKVQEIVDEGLVKSKVKFKIDEKERKNNNK